MPRASRASADTIFAKIKEDDRKRFAERVQKLGVTEKEVIQKLVRRFNQMDDLEVRAFLAEEPPPIRSLAEAIELLEWGDHAFSKFRWEWCADVYMRVYEITVETPELRRFALYKLGFVFIELGLSLRNELMASVNPKTPVDPGPEWGEYYDAIDDAWRAALHFNQKFLEIGEHPVIRYNIACCRGLLARSLVERVLTPRSKWVRQAAEHAVKLDKKEISEIPDKWWEDFGTGWRADVTDKDQVRRLDRAIVAFAEGAISELKVMADGVGKGESDREEAARDRGPITPKDPSELVRLSKNDHDFKFIRFDPKTASLFRDWDKAHATTTTKLTSFRRLWASLPDPSPIRRAN
jgi:hypothetical protein